MCSYSYNGYCNRLKMQNFATLLVEGPSDKAAFVRVFNKIQSHDPNSRFSQNIFIDSADMIKQGKHGPCGNREKLQNILDHVKTTGVDKVVTFMDREYNRMALDGYTLRDELNNTHYCNSPEFWTKGHSIENYYFDSQLALNFIRIQYPDLLPLNKPELLTAYIIEALNWSMAVSMCAYRHLFLSRIDDIFDFNDWNVTTKIELDLNKIHKKLQDRAVSITLADFKNECAQFYTQASRDCNSRWFTHGHLGDSAFWAAIGQIFHSFGGDRQRCRDLANGHKDLKENIIQDAWVDKMHDRDHEFPHDFIGKLRALNNTVESSRGLRTQARSPLGDFVRSP